MVLFLPPLGYPIRFLGSLKVASWNVLLALGVTLFIILFSSRFLETALQSLILNLELEYYGFLSVDDYRPEPS